MKKYILKPIALLGLLVSPVYMASCTNDEHKELIHSLIKHTADFVEFSGEWTDKFFDTTHHGSFATFTQQFTEATQKFDHLVVKPLCKQVSHHARHSPYHSALAIGKDIVCTLHKQADHVCSILNKNIHNKNSTFVGIALLETKKYTSTKCIKELEEKFNQFAKALKNIDPEIALYAQTIGHNILQTRKSQHDMGMDEQRKALSHRMKCR